MIAKKTVEQLLRDFDQQVLDTESKILVAITNTFTYKNKELPYMGEDYGNSLPSHIFPYEVSEEDGTMEALNYIFVKDRQKIQSYTQVAKRLGIDVPLLTVLGYWQDGRRVYPTEWVKILMEHAFNSGRSSMRGELRETGEKP